jgi:UDP-N-acetylmuramoylalanine--D-glutamate ligase
MIPIRQFAGREVAVFGLARGGAGTARALAAGGAKVLAWDEAEAVRVRAEAEGLALSDINARDWRNIAALIISPAPGAGAKPHRIVELARAVGTPVLGDVELFARAVGALAPHARPRVIGVAGARGDHACAALIGHILTVAGKDARVGGEGGAGVLELAPLHAGAIYVLALSGDQLGLTESLRCDVAALVEAGETAAHLQRVFANQGAGDCAIVSVDATGAAALCTRLTAAGGASVVPISALQALGRGVSALGASIYDATDGPAQRVAALANDDAGDALRAAAAYAAARALGLEPRAIAAAMASFPGEWLAPDAYARPAARGRERLA